MNLYNIKSLVYRGLQSSVMYDRKRVPQPEFTLRRCRAEGRVIATLDRRDYFRCHIRGSQGSEFYYAGHGE